MSCFNWRPCHGGLGHHKPQRRDWFRASYRRKDQVSGICSSSLHTVSTVPGSFTFFERLCRLLSPLAPVPIKVFAYVPVCPVLRWDGPCPESSRPSPGLMGRRLSLSSLLWVTQSFTATLTGRASWPGQRNSDCGSTTAVWILHYARFSICVFLILLNMSLMERVF